jgi:phage terminase large subunit
VAKRTVLLDLLEILDKIHINYIYNKSESTITINKNTIRIIGLDSKDKVLGLKQDIIYINEGLTIPIDIYLQLLQRTTFQMIVDYNPSYDKHFLYDWAEHREDCYLIKSTIFDNHLAPAESIKQILSYEPTEKNIKQNTANEFYWRVYGLGERFKGEDVVIRKLYTYNKELDESEIDWQIMGGDFGFAMDWTVLVKVTKQKDSNSIYCRVMLRDKGLTNQMIAEKINNNSLIDKNIIQIWDSAEKKSITELRLANVNAVPATKGAHSIYFGIQKLQNFKIYVYDDILSAHLYNGLIKLRFKMDYNGTMVRDSKGYPILVDTGLDEVDALRYALEKYVNFI